MNDENKTLQDQLHKQALQAALTALDQLQDPEAASMTQGKRNYLRGLVLTGLGVGFSASVVALQEGDVVALPIGDFERQGREDVCTYFHEHFGVAVLEQPPGTPVTVFRRADKLTE